MFKNWTPSELAVITFLRAVFMTVLLAIPVLGGFWILTRFKEKTRFNYVLKAFIGGIMIFVAGSFTTSIEAFTQFPRLTLITSFTGLLTTILVVMEIYYIIRIFSPEKGIGEGAAGNTFDRLKKLGAYFGAERKGMRKLVRHTKKLEKTSEEVLAALRDALNSIRRAEANPKLIPEISSNLLELLPTIRQGMAGFNTIEQRIGEFEKWNTGYMVELKRDLDQLKKDISTWELPDVTLSRMKNIFKSIEEEISLATGIESEINKVKELKSLGEKNVEDVEDEVRVGKDALDGGNIKGAYSNLYNAWGKENEISEAIDKIEQVESAIITLLRRERTDIRKIRRDAEKLNNELRKKAAGKFAELSKRPVGTKQPPWVAGEK